MAQPNQYGQTKFEQEEAMFVFWCANNKNNSAVSREFSKSRTTISRIIIRNNWIKRYQERVIPQVMANSESEAAQEIISCVESARLARDKIHEMILGKESKAPKATWRDLFAAIELLFKLENDGMGEVEDKRGVNISVINYYAGKTPEERANVLQKFATRARRLAGLPILPGSDHVSGNGTGADVSEHVQ